MRFLQRLTAAAAVNKARHLNQKTENALVSTLASQWDGVKEEIDTEALQRVKQTFPKQRQRDAVGH